MANMTRYNPSSDVVSLREAMDRLFEDSFISPRQQNGWSGRGIAANLYETAEGLTLQIPAPGIRPEDVEVTVQEQTVNLKWETKIPVPEGATVHWNGLQSGQFQQSFSLPSSINSERVEATYTNGILTLHLPKAEHAKARTIQVRSK
jgi:HSP20 family protein